MRGEGPTHQRYLVHFSTLRKMFETELVIRTWISKQTKKRRPCEFQAKKCLCELVSRHTYYNMLHASGANYIYVVTIK